MKLLFVTSFAILLACCIPAGNSAMTKQAIEATKGMVKNICKGKTGVKQESLDSVKNGEFNEDDDKLKCYFGCLFEYFQIIKKGQTKPEQAIKQIHALFPEDMKESALKQVQQCKNLTGQDNCDLGFKIAKCAYETDPENFLVPL